VGPAWHSGGKKHSVVRPWEIPARFLFLSASVCSITPNYPQAEKPVACAFRFRIRGHWYGDRELPIKVRGIPGAPAGTNHTGQPTPRNIHQGGRSGHQCDRQHGQHHHHRAIKGEGRRKRSKPPRPEATHAQGHPAKEGPAADNRRRRRSRMSPSHGTVWYITYRRTAEPQCRNSCACRGAGCADETSKQKGSPSGVKRGVRLPAFGRRNRTNAAARRRHIRGDQLAAGVGWVALFRRPGWRSAWVSEDMPMDACAERWLVSAEYLLLPKEHSVSLW
jgi:hypothetical protein